MGTTSDKKWALEVAGVAPSPVLLRLLRSAFASRSEWLKEVAYRQVARLGEIPDYIATAICQALVDMTLHGQLSHERHATYAHLSRLDKAPHFLSVMRLLLWAPFIDLGAHFALLLPLLVVPSKGSVVFQLAWTSCFLAFSYSGLWWIGRESLILFGRSLYGALLLAMIFNVRLLSLMALTIPFAVLPSLLIFLVYVESWALFALLSSRARRFTHPLWWPMLPIVFVLVAIRNARSLLVALSAILRQTWRDLAFEITLGAVIVLIGRWDTAGACSTLYYYLY